MVIEEKDNRIDVICAHTKDGRVIPMKLRVVDEDGETQSFVVQEYRELTYNSSPNPGYNVPIFGNHIVSYECKINVLGTARWLKIAYHSKEMIWRSIGTG